MLSKYNVTNGIQRGATLTTATTSRMVRVRDSSVVHCRKNRVERNNCGSRSLCRESRQEERHGFNDSSLYVRKMLESWGIRYSGEVQDSSERVLSRLKICKRATGISDFQLLSYLPSVLVKEASDWCEVYQEEILTCDFKTLRVTCSVSVHEREGHALSY